MRFEASDSQKYLLEYLENCGGAAEIEWWMANCTIASLQRRDAISAQVVRKKLKLTITSIGRFMLDYKPVDYYETLKEVGKLRHG